MNGKLITGLSKGTPVQYISRELREPAIAQRLVGKTKEAVMSIAEVDNYILFYVISEKDMVVTVVRILYVRRDWLNLLQNIMRVAQ